MVRMTTQTTKATQTRGATQSFGDDDDDVYGIILAPGWTPEGQEDLPGAALPPILDAAILEDIFSET